MRTNLKTIKCIKDATDRMGQSALDIAASLGYSEIVRELLSAGASVFGKASGNSMPFSDYVREDGVE